MCGCQGNGALKAVATVNGEKISLGDFNERFTEEMKLLRDQASLKPEDYDRLKEGVLYVLIDEKIMFLRAGELNLSVSDTELAKRMEAIKEGYSPEGFEKVLAAQGIRYDAWKKALKTRMILEKLTASDVNARISVTEEEAEDYYRVHRGEYTQKKEVHVTQIVLRDREKAEKVLNRLKAGEDFGKVAREVSIGIEATRGGDLGWISRGIMPEAIDCRKATAVGDCVNYSMNFAPDAIYIEISCGRKLYNGESMGRSTLDDIFLLVFVDIWESPLERFPTFE
jgi:parvulin-like peptidyl-prolyl isomerase